MKERALGEARLANNGSALTVWGPHACVGGAEPGAERR
jgi:hypothetical protein